MQFIKKDNGLKELDSMFGTLITYYIMIHEIVFKDK